MAEAILLLGRTFGTAKGFVLISHFAATMPESSFGWIGPACRTYDFL
ncbi:hypothetical protein ABIE33_003429 [Ensifer sp. 4252]